GATFLGVLATAGCAALCPALGGRTEADADTVAVVESRPVARAVDVTPWPDAARVQNNKPLSGVVNVFGEFGGARRNGPVRPIGEAGFQQHTATDEGEDSGVAVDPTGRWMVFASTRHSEHADIYLQRVDGTSVTQLTSDTSDDAYPSFSPDGRQIAFCSTRAGNWQIYLMDTDGRNVVQVTNGLMQA